MDAAEVGRVLTAVLADHDLELESVEIAPSGRRTRVRVVVDGDGPDGHGPGLDDIADATKTVSAALDASPVTGDAPYTLEVTSRGVSRPLTEPKHYRRNAGRLVQVHLADGSEVTGRIGAVHDTGVELDVDGDQRTVELDQVTKAVVQIEFRRASRAEQEE